MFMLLFPILVAIRVRGYWLLETGYWKLSLFNVLDLGSENIQHRLHSGIGQCLLTKIGLAILGHGLRGGPGRRFCGRGAFGGRHGHLASPELRGERVKPASHLLQLIAQEPMLR
jgi:hypothetical protein